MKVPDGVDTNLVIRSRTETLLQRAVSKGRAFRGQPWYVEPLLFPNKVLPDNEGVKVVKTAATRALQEFSTIAEPEPPGYYVIVGLGAAAVVNHTTLRQSKAGWDRVGDAPIVHLGFGDPWRNYRDHEMGQIANLLHMPGYERNPIRNGENLLKPRRAQTFADDTRDELQRLAGNYPFGVVPAWLAVIQDRTKAKPLDPDLKALKDQFGSAWSAAEACLDAPYPAEYPPFRLLIVDQSGTPRLLYARKVDVCTGNGRPRISIPKRVDATFTYGAKPWEPPESWQGDFKRRTVLSGLEALCTQTEWLPDQHVCVVGSGGVGVNMVEIGRETSGVKVDWLASGTTHKDSFFNPRNDPLLKGWVVPKDPLNPQADSAALLLEGKKREPLEIGALPKAVRENVKSLLIPADPRWRFMQVVRVGEAPGLKQAVLGQETVALTFERSPADDLRDPDVKPLPAIGLDAEGNVMTLDAKGQFPFPKVGGSPTYQRVILCSGQNPAAVGQAMGVTKLLIQKGPIKGPGDRLVGLELADGAVRVLGSAATANNDWVNRFKDAAPAFTKLKDFAATIPAQAGSAVNLALFALNTLNVAYANGFFTTAAPNYNINLATEEELAKLLGNPDYARAICDVRKTTANGFQDAADVIRQVWANSPPADAAAALKRISFSYAAPDPNA